MKYLILCAALILPSIAHAETLEPNDKALALSIKPQPNECLADFGRRVKREVSLQPISELSFNEHMSGVVYKQLYWKNSDRGVAFILPVKAKDEKRGVLAADIACFYSIVSGKLEFQYSQQIAQRI